MFPGSEPTVSDQPARAALTLGQRVNHASRETFVELSVNGHQPVQPLRGLIGVCQLVEPQLAAAVGVVEANKRFLGEALCGL
jgi:hypothetical protein